MANNRLGTVSNLTENARHDLYMVHLPDGFPEGVLQFDIVGTPRKITGIQKAAQLFLKVLFTRQGSDMLRPDHGTLFSDYVRGANKTGMDVEIYNNLTEEVRKAETFVKNATSSLDDASAVQSIEVIAVDMVDDSLSLALELVTRAGELSSISIPFPQTDLKVK